MLRITAIKSISNRLKNFIMAMAFVATQALPFAYLGGVASAAGTITAANHEGQLKPAGTYSNGNITTYAELDPINFRFTLDSSGSTSGQINVNFTGTETVGQACTFFQQEFTLGTHDGSASSVVSVSGATPTVTTVGTPVANGDEWVQTLNVNFSGAGEAVVNYYLNLTDEAGDCGGSSQHSRLANATNKGDFANIGAQNVPVPAKDIIELATITVTKYVDVDGDGQSDRTATAGEWSFSLDGGAPVSTDANGQVIFEHLQTGDYDIAESGPSDYSFLSVSGTNCEAGTTSGTAVASVTAAPTAVDASCDFYNGIRPGSITIVKDSIPNSSDTFDFTASGTGVSNFTLDGDTDPTVPNSKTFNKLVPGDYTFTESAKTGWDFDSISCNRDADVDKTGPSVTIHLAAGESVTCTYTNRERGTITVHKVTDPADDTTPFTITASTQNGDIDGSAVRNDLATNNSVVYDVSQGDYSVVESAKEGWIEDDSDCATLTVSHDDLNVSCTIYNTKKATLVIVKDAVPNDAQDFSFTTTGTGLSAFSLDDDSDATLSNSKSFSVAPGEYSVTEGAVSGWKLTGLTCNTNNYTTATSKVTVNLSAGQTTTCTFTNTKLGSIAGTKYKVNADGSTVQTLEGWTIQLKQGDTVLQSTTTDKDGNYLFTDLLPDTYNILEVLQGGWTQIFSPDPVNLTAGQTSTGNDFGNFENGSISGYKFNDLNGDGTKDDAEPKLGSWTINLYDDQDVLLDSKVTDATTGYTFGNLAPGEYKVCEVGKPGWTQTTTPTCYTIEVDESGETNSAVFGNQARGSITVIKNVDNGFGAVTQDASGWTWDYDGTYEDGSNESAGSTNTVAVAADSYTINEDQKTDYHFTSVVCTNDGKEFDVDQAESISVRVAAGDDIVCTFTNTRDTGYISVTKYLYPEDDQGLFDLQVNGNTEFEDASDGDTTGDIKVVTGDSNNVGELAGTDTDLAHYDSFWVCYSPDKFYIYGQGALSDNFAVSSNGQHVYCAFYNQRLATLTINKDALPNDPQLFDFTIDRENDCEEVDLSAQTLTRIAEEEGCGIEEVSTFQLQDYQDSTKATHTEELSEGWYRVTETDTEGWVLTDVDCGEADVKIDGGSVYVYLEYGDQVSCTYTNTKLATVTVVKDAQPDSSQAFNFTTSLGDSFTLTDNGVVSTNSKTFTDVMPGTYTISEESVAGWNLHSINCGEGTQISYAKGELSLVVEPGANVTCTFVNTKIPGKVLGTTTELVNTGDNGLANILAGTILISFALAARWFGRKQNATNI